MAWRIHFRLRIIPILVLILLLPSYLYSQEDSDQELAKDLFNLINRIRAQVGVRPVRDDTRLTEFAGVELAESIVNPQLFERVEDETNLRKQVAAARVPATTIGEVRLVLPDLGSDEDFNDRAVETLQLQATLKTLLDPRFSLAGVSITRKDMNIYGLGILVAPLREMEIDEAEKLFLATLQKARTGEGQPEFSVTPFKRLREASCEMARRDSLTPSLNVLHSVFDTKKQISGTFAFTSGDPEDISASIITDLLHTKARSPKDRRVISVGGCLASSRSYPNGSYWFIVALYDY
jgi:hypothetical protein